MRRISTYSLLLLCALASIPSSAQNPTSTCSTPNPNVCSAQGGAVVNTFDTQAQTVGWVSEAQNGGFLNYSAAAGNYNNQTGQVNNFPGLNYVATITSPSFNKGSNFPGQVQAGFVLTKGNNVIVDSIVIRVIESNTWAIEAQCTQIPTPGTAPQQICFGVFDPDITPGFMFNYQFLIYYRITANTNNNISFDNFGYAALSNAPLPVRFTSLQGHLRSDNRMQLTWNVEAEQNVSGYEIERSATGTGFARIGFVPASGQRTYTYTDAAPLATGFYRIKSVDVDGKYGYSTIIRVTGNNSAVVMKAFMSGMNSLIVQHDAAPRGSRIMVSTADGRMIRSVVPQVGAQQTTLDLAAAGRGMYIVRYETGNGEVSTIKIMKQ